MTPTKAEQLIRNLARRLEQMAPGVSATILEGMDELLTVVRLKLPLQLRRSLACTNIQILGCVCVRISMSPDLKKMRLTEWLRQGKILI